MPKKPKPILSLADATVEIATALNKGVPVAPFGRGGWPGGNDREAWDKAERLVLEALRAGAITASGYDLYDRANIKPNEQRVAIPSDRWVSLDPLLADSRLEGDGFDFRHIVVPKSAVETLKLGPFQAAEKSRRGRTPVHDPVRFWQIVALKSGVFERFPKQAAFLETIADAWSELSLDGTGIPQETYLKERWDELIALRKEIEERKAELDD